MAGWTAISKVKANHYVTITCNAPRSSVRVLMDESIPTITTGYGGFEEIARPGRRALVGWTGVPPYRMTLGVVFDGHAKQAGVDNDCKALERMASMEHAFNAPPKVKVKGTAIPKAGLDWRIEELAWGDAMRNARGRRTRQYVTLTLIQAVDDATVKVKASAHKRQSGRTVKLPPPGGQVALQRVAAKYLGAAKRWKEIAKLNKIRVPKKAKAGMTLRLP